jgi:hypothetical protein
VDFRSPQAGARCRGTAAPYESRARPEHSAWPAPAPSSQAAAHSCASILRKASCRHSFPNGAVRGAPLFQHPQQHRHTSIYPVVDSHLCLIWVAPLKPPCVLNEGAFPGNRHRKGYARGEAPLGLAQVNEPKYGARSDLYHEAQLSSTEPANLQQPTVLYSRATAVSLKMGDGRRGCEHAHQSLPPRSKTPSLGSLSSAAWLLGGGCVGLRHKR